MNNLSNYLFETKALRVCPENKPFWYTSGKIGPYYINTHFLYTSEEQATTLLNYIDTAKDDILTCPEKIYVKILEEYNSSDVYRDVIDTVYNFIKENIDLSEIDYISGGERRDWFFSLILANKLQKPHITIYKDLSAVISNYEFTDTKKADDLNGSNVLHIADLLTVASSYERAWIPAINGLNGKIIYSLAVVDRLQGGSELLNTFGIKSYSLMNIDEALFENALSLNFITKEQYDMIIAYMKDPDIAMKDFLNAHPEFMENALNSDPKTIERAKLCLEKGFYN